MARFVKRIRRSTRTALVFIALVVVMAGSVYLFRERAPKPVESNFHDERTELVAALAARKENLAATTARWARHVNDVGSLARELSLRVTTLTSEGAQKGSWEIPYVRERGTRYREFADALRAWLASSETIAHLKKVEFYLSREDVPEATRWLDAAEQAVTKEGTIPEELRAQLVMVPLDEYLYRQFQTNSQDPTFGAIAAANPLPSALESLSRQFAKDEPDAAAKLARRLKLELTSVDNPGKAITLSDWETKLEPLGWLVGKNDADVLRWEPSFRVQLSVDSLPTGSDVETLDGVHLGATPLKLAGHGRLRDRLRLVHTGYFEAVRVVDVVAGKDSDLKVELTAVNDLKEGVAWRHPALGFELAWFPKGSFAMGSVDNEPGRSGDERQHDVTLSQGFWLCTKEVDQDLWTSVMGNNPSNLKGPHLPVERVTWSEAKKFCEVLTERERLAGRLTQDHRYELPTEAQWEYACRQAPVAVAIEELAWCDENSTSRTHGVGQKSASAGGLYDLYGNVFEWVLDWYGPYSSDPQIDPVNLTPGVYRIARGGCWALSKTFCRAALRYRASADGRSMNIGFRFALVRS